MTKINVPTVHELNKIVKEAKKDDFVKIREILSDRESLIARYEDLKEQESQILKNLIKDIIYAETVLNNMKTLKKVLEKENY